MGLRFFYGCSLGEGEEDGLALQDVSHPRMEFPMKLYQRAVLLLKVLVFITISSSPAWASNPLTHPAAGVSANGVAGPTLHAIFKSESEPGDQGQGGSSGDDDQVDGDDDSADSATNDGDGKTDRQDDDSVDHGKASEGQY